MDFAADGNDSDGAMRLLVIKICSCMVVQLAGACLVFDQSGQILQDEDAGTDDATILAQDSGTLGNDRRVFRTDQTFTGNLGGLDGADQTCQTEANAAGLGGVWRAWLADSTGSPANRFVQGTGRYLRLDGVRIADDWDDLLDGQINAPIDLTATGQVDGFGAWSNVNPLTGEALELNSDGHCADWWIDTSINGHIGYANNIDGDWSRGGNQLWPCDSSSTGLYCFEQ